MTIEALNPAQKERIAEYRDAQIEISRSTGPARYEVAAAAARRMLEVSEIELDPDHRIEFAPNPIAAAASANTSVVWPCQGLGTLSSSTKIHP